MLNATELRALLSYNSETGEFHWLQQTGHRCVGDIAGSINKTGYSYISIGRTKYLAHRLAWLHSYGEWPENHIDHINGDRSDNRLINLRSATRSQNLHNAKRRSDSLSGMKGVTWSATRGRWRARVLVNGKDVWTRWFKSADEAKTAYCAKAMEIHGEFWRAE